MRLCLGERVWERLSMFNSCGGSSACTYPASSVKKRCPLLDVRHGWRVRCNGKKGRVRKGMCEKVRANVLLHDGRACAAACEWQCSARTSLAQGWDGLEVNDQWDAGDDPGSTRQKVTPNNVLQDGALSAALNKVGGGKREREVERSREREVEREREREREQCG